MPNPMASSSGIMFRSMSGRTALKLFGPNSKVQIRFRSLVIPIHRVRN
jgi:hypothetical protein